MRVALLLISKFIIDRNMNTKLDIFVSRKFRTFSSKFIVIFLADKQKNLYIYNVENQGGNKIRLATKMIKSPFRSKKSATKLYLDVYVRRSSKLLFF